MFSAHLCNARQMRPRRYHSLCEFVHHNNDGPANPYAVVYDRRRVEQNFPSFRILRVYKRFMHAAPLATHQLPGEGLLGWHLWVHLKPLATSDLARVARGAITSSN